MTMPPQTQPLNLPDQDLDALARVADFVISAAVGALITVPAGGHLTGATTILSTFILPIAISIPFFVGSRMGSIYEVPPKHRDSSWSTGPAANKTEEPNDSK